MSRDKIIEMLVGFISSLISGGVAGFVAGRFLQRQQFNLQLLIGDREKLTNIKHTLEEAQLGLQPALFTRLRNQKKPGAYTQEEVDEAILKGVMGAGVKVRRVADMAEFLNSDQSQSIKNHLTNKVLKDKVWKEKDIDKLEEHIEMLKGEIQKHLVSGESVKPGTR